MKKIFGLCLILFAAIPLMSAKPRVKPLKVVTTLPILKYLVAEMGGDLVHVESLTSAKQDPHFVTPRPTLMKKVRKADAFVHLGLSFELWADKVVQGAMNHKIALNAPGHIVASKGISTLERPSRITRELGDVHPAGNPHIWFDPVRVKAMARNIADGLKVLRPLHVLEISKRLKDFEKNIDVAMLAWTRRAVKAKTKRFVSYHSSWTYFARRFGFEVPITIEEKAGVQPSARHRDRVVKLMQEKNIRTIFMADYYPRKAANYIAGKTNAQVITMPLDINTAEGIHTYFDLINMIFNRLGV